ncbi:hypothetical protein Tsubulata_916850 [Turnera subulata]|uniref:DNA 3'-5' helicase n=1 Tax=Turnera subulata TaxID=218843 RepID=A0A9Q0FXG5_9ROSI|nr:hypothetical protein Tsubulata_916850 [Turnera subulata]
MDSDSDSDGSHVSATPPGSPNPPPRPKPAPAPPPPPPTLFPLHKPKAKIKKPSSKQKPPKPPPPPPENPRNKRPPCSAPPLSSSPVKFRILSRQDHQPSSSLPEILRAGYFTNIASFTDLSTDSLEKNVDVEPPLTAPPADPPAFTAKKHKLPNLIRAREPLPPVTLRKCSGSEGNFVKLNLNKKFNRRKFLNRKCSTGKSYSRSYRKSKRRKGGECDDEAEGDEFVVEISSKEMSKGFEAVEEAVEAVRDGVSDENLVKLLKVMYGYDSFRDGQLEAIKMVLEGKSTMLVLPTGAGKSICYQIPAMVLPGITLVVSPLVALMIDQLKQLPPAIQGGLLSSSQTSQEVADTLGLLQEGALKVLFVSPERFLNAEFLSCLSPTSISLLVVDEAHCVSEWSHNFRPSYMRLRASLLRSRLNVGCILAMTATATATTLNAVMSALEIPPTNLIQKSLLRENLKLSVSMSGNRIKDLLTLIKSSPFEEVKSIIIYCKFQSETDTISRYLCDNNINAKSYHGALPSKDRRSIQEWFCSNKIRVVVATVAFGMGLDKRDVGAVIHYSLPESLEEYVQEIGRAGRDGRLSYCHLFFDDITYFKLRSLMYSDGVDEYAVNKFLCEVFKTRNNSHGKIYSIIKESAPCKFDMKEEVMLTLLTQLELGEVQYLRLLPPTNVTCTLNFYKTSPALLADKDIVVSTILKKSETKYGQYVFDIPTVASSIGVTITDLSSHLQNLKSTGEITYDSKDPAYCYSIVQVPEDFCSLSLNLTKWLSEVEHCKVQKLDAMFKTAAYAVNEGEKLEGDYGSKHTLCVQRKILDYFKEDVIFEGPNAMGQSSPFLRADIKVFLQSNSHAKFTPRAVARIMHGIASPAYPSTIWSKSHFWGRYSQIDFQVVMDVAKEELLSFVGKGAP